MIRAMGEYFSEWAKKYMPDPIHYPLMGAVGYLGLAVWHGGFSGSAPLLVATAGHFLEKEIGIIKITQTLFSHSGLSPCLASPG